MHVRATAATGASSVRPLRKPPRYRRSAANTHRLVLIALLALAALGLLALRPTPRIDVDDSADEVDAAQTQHADDPGLENVAKAPAYNSRVELTPRVEEQGQEKEEQEQEQEQDAAVPKMHETLPAQVHAPVNTKRAPRSQPPVARTVDEFGLSWKPSAPGRKTVPVDVEELIAAAQGIANDTRYRYDPARMILTKTNHLKLRPSDRIHDMRCLPDTNPFEQPSAQVDELRRRRRRDVKAESEDVGDGAVAKPLHKTCAIVGNAGSSLTVHWGSAIDAAEAVIRINQGPTKGYEPFVGSRTTYRLINKKWAAVYTAKDDGRQILLPSEAQNATYVVTRGSTWQLERLFHVVRRLRPDIRVYFLANGPLGRARWMLQRFRDVANSAATKRGSPQYGGGDSPSSGAIALYFALQVCEKVSVFGLGQAAPDTPARVAKRYAMMWLDLRRKYLAQHPEQSKSWASAPSNVGFSVDYNPISCRPVAGGPPVSRQGRGRAPVIPVHPLPYHYFLHWPDSYQLRAHPHHAFDLENDFFHALSEASQRTHGGGGSGGIGGGDYRYRTWDMSFCETPLPCNDEARCKSQLNRMSQGGMMGSGASQYGGNAALSVMLQRTASERTGQYGVQKGRGNDGKFVEASHYDKRREGTG
ncbi:glycosyltransferase family 29 protein [Pseudoscourfieldia marina]